MNDDDPQNTTTLTILGNTKMLGRPETGFDTVIVDVPAQFVLPKPQTPGGNPRLGLLLQAYALTEASRMGEGLRMSAWWITRDPEVIRQRGLMHDCSTCRAGVDQALAKMREFPDTVLAVGQLSWCQP